MNHPWAITLAEARKTPGRRYQVEALVLAEIIRSPVRFAWELEALDPRSFSDEVWRYIARAVCDLRDEGQRRIHWKRVRMRMPTEELKAEVHRLFWSAGTCVENMPYWVGELNWYAERKRGIE